MRPLWKQTIGVGASGGAGVTFNPIDPENEERGEASDCVPHHEVSEFRTQNRFAELSEDSEEESVESATEDTRVVVPHVGSRVIGQAVGSPRVSQFRGIRQGGAGGQSSRVREISGPRARITKFRCQGVRQTQHSATIASSAQGETTLSGGHDVGSGSDTESLFAASEASGEVIPPSGAEPVVEVQPPRAAGREIRAALDAVDLPPIFQRRAVVMQSILFFLRGPFRNAMVMALEEICARDEVSRTRGWKLFLLLPRFSCTNLFKVGPFPNTGWCKIKSIFPGTVGSIASRERGRS